MKSGRLTYKKDVSMGVVIFPQDWIQHPYVFRLDCIRDWIYDLQKEFDSILDSQEKERNIMKKIDDRLEQWADRFDKELSKELYGPVVEAQKENTDE